MLDPLLNGYFRILRFTVYITKVFRLSSFHSLYHWWKVQFHFLGENTSFSRQVHEETASNKSNHSHVFHRTAILKNLAKTHQKRFEIEHFSTKVLGLGLQIIDRDSGLCYSWFSFPFFSEFLASFSENVYYRTLTPDWL